MTDQKPVLPRERLRTRRNIPPVATLVGDLKYQLLRLVRGELQLLRAELTEKAKKLATGVGSFAVAAMLVLFALGCLIAAAVLGLALVLPAWLSALIIGFALLVIAAVLALVGRQSVLAAAPPVPTKTIASVRADIDAVTHGTPSAPRTPAALDQPKPPTGVAS